MSLKLIFQNVEIDHFVKMKKDYFSEKEKRKRNLQIERTPVFQENLLQVLITETQPNWAIEFQMINNSSGVQAGKAKIYSEGEGGGRECVKLQKLYQTYPALSARR